MFDNVPESITRFFDFKAFARELFMSDYDMGDGGHVFRTLLSLSAPSEKEPPQGGFFFAHWCRRNHTEQVPTKFDELYSRVAALIKAFGRQQPKGTEVSAETRKKAKNAYLNKRFL